MTTSSLDWDSLSYKLQPWILEGISSLGYDSMTPVQASTIPLFCKHKDVVVEAVTGSGKTMAYIIPVLEKIAQYYAQDIPLLRGDVLAMVLLPTRELASQVQRNFDQLLKFQPDDSDITTQLLVGAVGSVREDVYSFLQNRPQILIGTVGRMLEFLGSSNVKPKSLQVLVLDEADRLLDLGFSHDVLTIIEKLPRQRRTGLFSATISSAGSDIFKTGMANPVRIVVKNNNSDGSKNAVPDSLGISYISLTTDKKIKTLLELLSKYHYKKAIVYLPTCVGVQYFHLLLQALINNLDLPISSEDLKMFSIHGKLETAARLKALNGFADSFASKSVLLTTDVAARGLDIPEVDLVIQLDPPTDPDMFLHRSGRTGRANKVGKAIVMLNEGRELDYIDFMKVRNVQISELKFSGDLELDTISQAMHNWLLDDRARYDLAVRAMVAFVKSYSKHTASSIFRLQGLDYIQLCKMYGLFRVPKMPETKFITKEKYEEEKVDEEGWIIKVDMDSYKYSHPDKEEKRLEELRTHKKLKESKLRAAKRREQKAKNASWSNQTKQKEVKQERRSITEQRQLAKERERIANYNSEDEENEVDWKDAIREQKRRKTTSTAVQGSFDDL
ncbi:BA75_01578T0 [Komagataella pastoris]|uniref:ATP-dependent rRNA helicase SPB4 n=1 Tax=Komagataella pastoris TaxID=4922 RepID=A0A1B2J5H4_PICPA|nr:BA75_01578T0 [Komagataella pastoris]